MKLILLFFILCLAFDIQSSICHTKIKSVFAEANPSKELDSHEQKIIFHWLGISGNDQTVLDDALIACLNAGPKHVACNSFIATLVGIGANLPDILCDSNQKDEYIVTTARAAKKHLLCTELIQFKTLLCAKIFSRELLNEWLLLAADAGKYEAFKPLAEVGAEFDATDSDGNTIFHLLAQSPYNKDIPSDILCPHIVTSDVLQRKNKKGETPISLIEHARVTDPKQYFKTVVLTHCLKTQYTHQKYSLLQNLFMQLNDREAKEVEYIEKAIVAIAPYADFRYTSQDGKTILDFADPKDHIGQKVIQNTWDRFVQEGFFSVSNRNPSYSRKKKLMLDFLKGDMQV